MSVKSYLRRNWKSRAMQPVIYLPDGTPTQEEFDRDAATRPVIVGTLHWTVLHRPGSGRRYYFMFCDHGQTERLAEREGPGDDPFILAAMVAAHQNYCNLNTASSTYCGCEPQARRTS